MYEIRNQNFLFVCMFKLGEMLVNEFKKKKKGRGNCKMVFRIFIKIQGNVFSVFYGGGKLWLLEVLGNKFFVISRVF